MSRLDDILYKNQMEHLIQDEPNYGFCETCQEMADFRCHRANKYLPYAKQELKDLVLELMDSCNAIHENGNPYIDEVQFSQKLEEL